MKVKAKTDLLPREELADRNKYCPLFTVYVQADDEMLSFALEPHFRDQLRAMSAEDSAQCIADIKEFFQKTCDDARGVS